MFTWILIIFTICLIFGVIKIEQIKDLIKKYGPEVRQTLSKTKDIVVQKASEIKKSIDEKKAQITADKKNNASGKTKKADIAEPESEEENKESSDNQ